MHRLFLLSIVRLFGILIGTGTLSLCAGGEYTSGQYVSPFEKFEFEEKTVSFNKSIHPRVYLHATALLYVFRKNDDKKKQLLGAIQNGTRLDYNDTTTDQLKPREGYVYAIKIFGKGFNPIFFNLNSQEWESYKYYCDSSREHLLVEALAGREHKGPEIVAKNATSSSTPHNKGNPSGGLSLWSFARNAFSFFRQRPYISTALIVGGGIFWYRLRARSGVHGAC
jgi:hypothetical protein